MPERISLFNTIAPEGRELLVNAGFELYEGRGSDAQAILLRSHKLTPADLGSDTQVIARAGVGTDNIDVEEASERGIVVVNTPGANANAVAELVTGAMFATARNMFEAERFVHGVGGGRDRAEMEAAKKQFAGYEIAGRTLGVVGLGAVGVRVANNGVALGMNVKGFETALNPMNAHRLDRRVALASSLEEVFSGSDFVSLHIPFLPETRGIVSEQELKRLRMGGVLLNFARPEIVDQDAIVQSLEEGRLGKYVNDFPTDLNVRSDVISLPHLGASTEESETNCAVMAAQQIINYLRSGEITNSVNFPDIQLIRSGLGRIVVLHSNVPRMLAEFTQIFGDAGLNVTGTANHSRSKRAASIFDLDTGPGDVLDDLAAEISQLDGVYRTRVL